MKNTIRGYWLRSILASACTLVASFAIRADEAPVAPLPLVGQADPTAESAAPGSAPAVTERQWSGAPTKPAMEKTFWEKVPPIKPYPRAGNFAIAPSGPGIYTIFDLLRGRELENRPKTPYLQWGQNPNPFYNIDFRYIDDPKYVSTDYADPVKRIHIGDNWLLSTGGEVRNRYATIENAALNNKKGSAGADDSFNLFRTRVYLDTWYLDRFRLYTEFISANSSTQAIPYASTDVARADFLDLFIDAKLFSIDDNGAYARVGRQEMLFGSQRLISPSDWANVRRTFQGARGLYHSDKIEEDFFVVNPVVPDPSKISSINDKQLFAGNWFKYRFDKDNSVDLYYLYLTDDTAGVAKGTGKNVGGYNVSTYGGRFVGERNQFLYDFEGAIQGGSWANQNTLAGFYVAGLGYWFKDAPAAPTLWAYYDWASGDQNPGVGGTHGTFNPLFPFGHTYYAGLDAIGRPNIKDFHLELALFPTNWMRITGGYHMLTLDSAKDALYSSTGSVVRQDLTGKSGTGVGNALNAVVQFHIDDHNMFLVNYGHLFAGDFIRGTATTPGAKKDLDAWWVQYTYKW